MGDNLLITEKNNYYIIIETIFSYRLAFWEEFWKKRIYLFGDKIC